MPDSVILSLSIAQDGKDVRGHRGFPRYSWAIHSYTPNLTFGAGIGLAIAEYLISKSHNVVILARSKEPLEKLRAENPKQVRALAGDLNESAVAKKAVDSAIEAFGQLDGLVVNHGAMFGVNRVADCDIDEWRKMFDINYFSAVAFVRFLCEGLDER